MTYIIEIKNAPLIRRFASFIIDYLILLPLILILYQLWKESLWEGQSVGNKLTGIKLIHAVTGRKPSKKQIIIKNLIFIITLTLGGLTIFLNDSRRSLSDLLTSNMVIRNFKTDS